MRHFHLRGHWCHDSEKGRREDAGHTLKQRARQPQKPCHHPTERVNCYQNSMIVLKVKNSSRNNAGLARQPYRDDVALQLKRMKNTLLPTKEKSANLHTTFFFGGGGALQGKSISLMGHPSNPQNLILRRLIGLRQHSLRKVCCGTQTTTQTYPFLRLTLHFCGLFSAQYEGSLWRVNNVSFQNRAGKHFF